MRYTRITRQEKWTEEGGRDIFTRCYTMTLYKNPFLQIFTAERSNVWTHLNIPQA